MARVGSGDFLDTGTWADEDDPGAGAQTFDSTGEAGTGLNGNFTRFRKAIASILSGFGTFKNDIIDGNALKNTVVDGSTIEASASTGSKNFRIKDGGVAEAKIATGAVTESKLGSGAVTVAKLATDAVETAKIKDANVTGTKIAADAVSADKQPHDNNARRLPIPYIITSGTTNGEFRMLRAGAITGFSVYSASANDAATQTYATAVSAATGKFGAGDRLRVHRNTSTGVTQPGVSGTNVTALSLSDSNWATENVYCIIEVEFDD